MRNLDVGGEASRQDTEEGATVGTTLVMLSVDLSAFVLHFLFVFCYVLLLYNELVQLNGEQLGLV